MVIFKRNKAFLKFIYFWIIKRRRRNMFPIARKKVVIFIVIAVVILALFFGLFFGLQSGKPETLHKGAVVANGAECAEIGSDILKRGGSVADAAIATLFCEGVSCPQSMGLGGGFLMTIYIKNESKVESLIARETAPAAATEDMFVNDKVEGGKAIAIPGELRGYWQLHQKYGKLEWATLIKPTIDLCRHGHVVTQYLSNILTKRESIILNSPSLSEIYVNPQTGKVWQKGDLIKRLKLAETLEIIAVEGEDALYKNGTIAQKLIPEMQKLGAILTEKDLMDYQVRWREPIKSTIINNQILYGTPLPASSLLVTFMLNILNGFLPDKSATSYHRIVEAFKFAYAKRGDLGDAEFIQGPEIKELIKNLTDINYAMEIRQLIKDEQTSNDHKYYGANFTLTPEDHGTAHINILAPNGDAIVVTSTINNIFGSKIRSLTTGIIMNDEMDDFSTPGKNNGYGVPPSPQNFIVPGKMPMSSMSPIIIIDQNGDVQMLVGGSGGIKITSSIAYVISRVLYFNESLADALEARRLHHQLIPMQISYEVGFDQTILNGLEKKDHKLHEDAPDSGFAAMTAIAREGNKLSAVFDSRRQGSVSFIETTS